MPRLSGSISDEALLACVALGEPDAVEEFITRYERRVYGAALTIVRDRSLAQEVAQDAFVRVWRHADTYDPRRGSVNTWLMRITHNLCVDALRVRRPVAVDPVTLLCLTDDHHDPTREMHAFAPVRQALLTLPPEQARTVLLASMYGYNAQMISELDRIPLGTAKTRIRLGLEKLRLSLDDRAADEEDR
ncbi:MAG: RNA polymerase sigma factor [Ilumatobacteraceae bacterium]